MSIGRQLKRYWLEFAAIIGIVVVSLGVASYVLSHQRLTFPWQHVYHVNADFTTAQAVTPGQGQEVAVAGVKVGEIKAVSLHDGLARVKLQIDKDKLPKIHKDATMMLRPKTGLQDMTIQMDPGSPKAGDLKEGETIPVAQTQPEVQSDEVLAALDSDTRSWLQTIVAAGDEGLKDNGTRLREVFKAAAPTLESTKSVTDAILARRTQLRRLVHNLRLLSDTAAARNEDISQLVNAANATFTELGTHDAALRKSFQLLPGTLQSARRALAATQPFARELKPAADALSPTVTKLTAALPQLDPLLTDATPATKRIRRLVRKAQPVVRDLRPAVQDLDATTPSLSGTFDVLNRTVNELAYNPDGDAEGFLFWFAWFAHNANSMLSTSDANGTAWRGLLMTSCSSLAADPALTPVLKLILPLPTCSAAGSGQTAIPTLRSK